MIDRSLNGKSLFVFVGSTPTSNTPALNMINSRISKEPVGNERLHRMISLFSYAINRSVWDNYSASELVISHGHNTSMSVAR